MCDSLTEVAVAASLIKPGQTFDVYASEDNFLRGGFIFEDVGVTGEHAWPRPACPPGQVACMASGSPPRRAAIRAARRISTRRRSRR